VIEAKLMQVSGGNKTGYFSCEIEWDDAGAVLDLKFKLEIFINQALDPKKKKEVLEHDKAPGETCFKVRLPLNRRP